MARPEKKVDAAFVKALAKLGLGLRTIKLTTLGMYGQAGWPDRMVLCPGGKAVFVELKAPGKVPTALQFERLDQLHALGFRATWSDNGASAAEWVLAQIRAPKPPGPPSYGPPYNG